MSKSVKLSTTVAFLLFATALYSWHWAQSRGAFGAVPVEAPIRLEEGASTKVPFSVVERGNHDVEIQYPSDASEDVDKGLYGISGKANLTSSGAGVVQARLPVVCGTGSSL
jgi:hypothetical protein